MTDLDAFEERRLAELKQIVAVRAAAAPSRRSRIRTSTRTRNWFLLPGAVTAAAVTAVALIGTAGTHTHPAHPRGPGQAAGPVTGTQLVLAAAVEAEHQPTGRYWINDTVGGTANRIKAKTGDYSVLTGNEEFHWESYIGSGGYYRAYTRDLPPHPFSAADKAAWRRAGSPDSFPVCGDRGDQRCTVGESPGGAKLSSTWLSPDKPQKSDGIYPFSGLGNVTLHQLQNLPTDPAALAARLFPKTRYPGYTPYADKIGEVGSIMLDVPLPPKLQAAMMRALLTQPGIEAVGNATDVLGRAGVAVASKPELNGLAKPGEGFTSRTELIFDRNTGALLGEQESRTDGGTGWPVPASGGLLNYQVTRSIGWSNSKPVPPTSRP